MLNLAPLRYSQVLGSMGGPVRSIESGAVTVMGERLHQANAYLSEKVRTWSRTNVLYGDPDGTGTAASPAVARHIAISEALERWAHHEMHVSSGRARYGFDVDPSSNGMAAYPGWLKRQARGRALAEMAERYCLNAWWAGVLEARPRPSGWPDVDAWEIDNPISDHVVVVLHTLADDRVHAYGFAAGVDLATAIRRASVEMVRSQFVLRNYTRRLAAGVVAGVPGLFEQRCLYFSTEEGYLEFCERTKRPRWLNFEPEICFDGEIPGPWSRYTCVWRVVATPASRAFLEPTHRFFFW